MVGMALLRFVVQSVVQPARLVAIVGPAALAIACAPVVTIDDEGSESSDSTDGSTTGPTTVGPMSTTAMTTVGSATVAETSATLGTVSASDTLMETEDEPEPLPDCPGVGPDGYAVGEPCTSNYDCMSGFCTLYTWAPPTPDAVCEVPPADCSMRITATSFDIVTRQLLPGSELRVVSALSVATDPTGAVGIVTAQSGADGRFDTVTPGPVDVPIGLFALLDAPGYHLTATELAVPLDEGASYYGVANDGRDLWLVSDDALAAWSSMLALDPAIPPEVLPLGPAGGVVGLVRDVNGAPVSGATVLSTTDSGSEAIVRYLNDDGTFGTTATGSFGLFVILQPALAEEFEAELGGMSLGYDTALSAPGVVITATFLMW